MESQLVGINILKRVIEYLSTSLPMDARSQQDALTIANERIEMLFAESIPARFHDPAYAKAERKVARAERSIRRNVR